MDERWVFFSLKRRKIVGLSDYVQTKDYEIGIYRFSTKHAALRSKSKKRVDSESA